MEESVPSQFLLQVAVRWTNRERIQAKHSLCRGILNRVCHGYWNVTARDRADISKGQNDEKYFAFRDCSAVVGIQPLFHE
jgi:hypothetical protein